MTDETTPMGGDTAPAVPRPGSAIEAAMAALDHFGYEIIANMPGGIGRRRVLELAADALALFAEEQRLIGAMKAHDSFDGILTEHALALDEIATVLREGLPKDDARLRHHADDALEMLEQEITHIRALGSVAATEEEEDAK